MLKEITNSIGNNSEEREIDDEFQYIDKGFIDELKFSTAEGKELIVDNISVSFLKALVGEIDKLTSKTIMVDKLKFDEILGKLLFGDKEAMSITQATLNIGAGFNKINFTSVGRPEWQSTQIALVSDITNPLKLVGIGPTEERPTENIKAGDYYLSTDEPALTVYVYTGKTWQKFEYQTLDQYRNAKEQDIIDDQIKQSITDLAAKEEEDVNQIKDQFEVVNEEIEEANTKISDNKTLIQANTEAIQKNAEDIKKNAEDIVSKISDAPHSTVDEQESTYARKNGEWKPIDEMFDAKFVLTMVREYLDSLPEGTELQKQEDVLEHNGNFIGLWNIAGKYNLTGFTTKEMVDYVEANKEDIDEKYVDLILDAYKNKQVLGTTRNNFGKAWDVLPFEDLKTEAGTKENGEGIRVSSNIVLATHAIENTEDGISITSDKKIAVSTPGKDYPSNPNAPVNVEYVESNLKVSTIKEENNRVLRVETFNAGSDPISTAASIAPNMGTANTVNAPSLWSNWYVRTKDYIYYKVDNVANQTASSFSFWFSIDKNGNIINMTSPGMDADQAVAGQSDFSSWIAFHPKAWNGETDNIVYWPSSGNNGSGQITAYKDGRFYGRVLSNDGTQAISPKVPVVDQGVRFIGGKSLKRSEHPRCILLNNSSTATVSQTANIIGVDMNGVESLLGTRRFNLTGNVVYGKDGIAAGYNHWFAQLGETNQFMAIDGQGECKTYVITDPETKLEIGNTVRNARNNYIELDNGDCVFFISDAVNNISYFVYCRDNFTEDESPFEAYRVPKNYANDKYPVATNFPFVEHGKFVYFFQTTSQAINATVGFPIDNSYVRFNKETKEMVSFVGPWQFATHCSIRAVKTWDPDEQQDYLWLFPSFPEVLSLGRNYICICIAPDGTEVHINLQTGQSTAWFDPAQEPADPSIDNPDAGTIRETVAWFDNSEITGEVRLGTWSYPLNPSGTTQWYYTQTSVPQVPYLAVTRKGIGVLLSNSAHDVCIFYGKGHFWRRDYVSNASRAFGPWSDFATDSTVATVLPGIDGVKLMVRFNNDLVSAGGGAASNTAVIYIKIDETDPLKSPTFFWKPYPNQAAHRRYFDFIDSANYYITDASEYKRVNFQEITPLTGGYATMVGMQSYEIEAPLVSRTLYLKNGEKVISETSI